MKVDKIDELKRLKSLLDEGTINKEEFNQLKKNILESNLNQDSTKMNMVENISPQNILNSEDANSMKIPNQIDLNASEKKISKKGKSEKLNLKRFVNKEEKLITPPHINSIKIDQIYEEDKEPLRIYLKQKIESIAIEDFTQDEMDIVSILFTENEVLVFLSNRKGMNYRGNIIGGIVIAIVSGVLLYILPCLIIFSVGLGWILSLAIAIQILRAKDATRMDIKYAYVLIGLVITVIIIYFVRGSEMFGS